MSHPHGPDSQSGSQSPVTQQVLLDPIVALAALCPLCALAALSPAAALAAISPVLALFNPAVNPRAAMLAFVSQPGLIQAQVGTRVSTHVAALARKHRLRR